MFSILFALYGNVVGGYTSDDTELGPVYILLCSVQFIFRKDFKFCTTFSNLQTLLFNEWCLKPKFGALDYFLRNSPFNLTGFKCVDFVSITLNLKVFNQI